MSIMVLAKRGSAAGRYEMFERKDMLFGHGPEREGSKRLAGVSDKVWVKSSNKIKW